MLGYYARLSFRSFRNHPALSALMVLLIAVGVAGSMVTFAALRAVSGDPIPAISQQLFTPQIDNRAPADRNIDGEPPRALSYIDAMALLSTAKGHRQVAIYPFSLPIVQGEAEAAPFSANGYAVSVDFFPMFNLPFKYGSPWSAVDEQRGSNAVVISKHLNNRLFAGKNSVGANLQLRGHDYRVIGVIEDWNPQPRFYAGSDINSASDQGDAPDLFLPFRTAVDAQIESSGSIDCTTSDHAASWEELLRSECNWISFWVLLPAAESISQYRNFLDGYSREQQRIGRWPWPPNVRLRGLVPWLSYMRAVPEEARLAFLVAVGLQAVCLTNVVGLLLAAFMRRRSEIAVRRALGAAKHAIHVQLLIEGAMVGIAGGLLGLLLTLGGIAELDRVFTIKIAHLVQVDPALLGLTLLTAVAATLIAALYPSWRAAQQPPAWQLKAN